MSDNKTKLIDVIADFRKSNTRSLKYHIDVFFNRILPDVLYPGNYFYNLREAIRENLTGWHRSLIWCPSQVTKVCQYKHYDVTLYLRWRHNDPWTAEFIIENDHVILWSEELIGNKNFTEETPIRVLELEMEKLYKKYFIDKNEILKLSQRRRKEWVAEQYQN